MSERTFGTVWDVKPTPIVERTEYRSFLDVIEKGPPRTEQAARVEDLIYERVQEMFAEHWAGGVAEAEPKGTLTVSRLIALHAAMGRLRPKLLIHPEPAVEILKHPDFPAWAAELVERRESMPKNIAFLIEGDTHYLVTLDEE